jgi:hypothetical protein
MVALETVDALVRTDALDLIALVRRSHAARYTSG